GRSPSAWATSWPSRCSGSTCCWPAAAARSCADWSASCAFTVSLSMRTISDSLAALRREEKGRPPAWRALPAFYLFRFSTCYFVPFETATFTCLGLDSGRLGISTVNTPFLYSALMASVFTVLGRVKLRLKEPEGRSTRGELACVR